LKPIPHPSQRVVGLVGLDRRGWHRLEQLSLRDDWFVAAVTDPRADRRHVAKVSCPVVVESLDDLLATTGLSGVIVTEPARQRANIVQRCISAGKEVWLEPPLSDDLRQVRRLQSLARERRVPLHVLQTQRYDHDYRAALAAVESGRLGPLRSIRLVAAEWTTFAGDQGAAACPLVDPVEQFGPHGFDQLLGLTEGDPHWIWARRCTGEDGFLAVIGFSNGVTAQLEVRRRARATLHTGWVLEGELASFQNGRLITVATDGELIDEPIGPAIPDLDPFFAALTNGSSLVAAEERRAWLTVGLMMAVQKSSLRNAAIRWDEVVGG
jgi:predicted dehydrogenase